jgi:type IV pilus assembly protein PilF
MKRSVARIVDKYFSCLIFLFLIIAISAVSGCINYEAANRHLNYGTAYIETGQYTPALKELMEADKNNPRDPKIKYYLGVCYHGKGLPKEATVEFKKAIYMKPDYSEAHNYLGLIYTESGQLDDAITEFQAALSNLLYETPSFAMSNLGWAYYKKGNYQAALSQYQEVLNRDPNSQILPIVERNIGIVLLAQGKYNQALSHLQKSLQIAPDFVPEQTHYWMGKTLAEQGKYKEAESEFQKSIEIAPNSKFAADSAAELENIHKKSGSPAVKPASTPKPDVTARVEDPSQGQPAAIAPVSEQNVTAPAKEESKEIVKAETLKAEPGPLLHTVKKGETLYSIARAYRLPVQTLCSANKKSINYRLNVGERLTIPSSGPKSDLKVKKDTAGQYKTITYHVKPGDSLTSVSKKFHTTMADIKKLNNLKRNTLDKGQVLKIRTTQ